MQSSSLITVSRRQLIGVFNSGEVGAGKLVLFPSHQKRRKLDFVLLPKNAKSTESTTYLVKGDSQESDDAAANICDGELVIVRNAFKSEELPGRMCILRLYRSEITLKRVEILPEGRVKLLCNNPAYDDIECDDGDVEVLGIVVGIHRDYF